MSALRKILISIAVALLAMATAAASSAGIAHDVPELDSISGFYWQRVIDQAHPAAPPRLIPLHDSGASFGRGRDIRQPVVCVRAGEHVVLHESRKGSSTVSLAATALESGACRGRVRVRIEVTGALTEVTVLGPGVGVLDKEGNKWR
jgi:hypothetical protein